LVDICKLQMSVVALAGASPISAASVFSLAP
jgi:hypothetical protein